MIKIHWHKAQKYDDEKTFQKYCNDGRNSFLATKNEAER